jgi:glycosyltransferase involved in cell wall biosynthesis
MPTISVITAVYRPDPEYLREARNSVATQELPPGWDLEWLVQEDGRSDTAEQLLGAEPWISHGRNRHGGQAITRNLALASSRGELVRNLDQDDVLAPGALVRDIAALDAHPDIGWATSRVLDLLPEAVQHWRSHGYRLPVHPTTLCIRRPLAVALGGWMAVPGSEDTGLLIAASVLTTGWFTGEVGLLYRKWPGQASASPDHTETIEWQARMSLISERAEQLAQLNALVA